MEIQTLIPGLDWNLGLRLPLDLQLGKSKAQPGLLIAHGNDHKKRMEGLGFTFIKKYRTYGTLFV